MRSILRVASLVAVLSGPLLRESEGAEDLIRSLAELGCPPLCEEIDGGVGDEPGSGILNGQPSPPAADDSSITSPLTSVGQPGPLALAAPGSARSGLPVRPHPSGALDGQDRLARYQLLLC